MSGEHGAMRQSLSCSDGSFGPLVIEGLFDDEAVLYGFDAADASCDLNRFVNGVLRTHKAAELNGALVRFDADLE